MRHIAPYPIWIGHIGDVNQPGHLTQAGIAALVDLADNEKPTLVFRDLVYCRMPLSDGAGNPPWLLRLTAETVARLIQANVTTLVFCGAGMSRSPSIVAAAISVVEGKPLNFGLDHIKKWGGCDLSPALWTDIKMALDS
jgi:hypothetical protein